MLAPYALDAAFPHWQNSELHAGPVLVAGHDCAVQECKARACCVHSVLHWHRACTVAVVPFTLLTSLWHISAFPIDHSHNAIALCGKPLRLVVQQRPWTLKQAIDTLFMSNRRAGATCCTTATRGYKARQCAATPHAHCVLSKATSR